MKKIVSFLILILMVGTAFAGSFTPYLATLDLHPAVLGGWCPTYAGVGGDYIFSLSNGDLLHADLSLEGGITERGLYQNPETGEYIGCGGNEDIALMDIVTFGWNLKSVYELSDKLSFSVGYSGVYEKRQDSMLVTGKYWPKGQKTERWMGGATKRKLTTKDSISGWLAEYEAGLNTYFYPELGNPSSVFNSIKTGVEFNVMTDTMVANDGFLAQFDLEYVPGILNKDANLLSADLDAIVAKTFVDKRFSNGLNMFAVSIIDRFNVNYTIGTKVPTYYQQSVSLGRKVRGFDTGSYGTTFTMVNNFEVRLSGPEPVDGVFLRTNFFFDCGLGAGSLFNTTHYYTGVNFLASVGVQEQIDYNDAFDLGLEVAYLLHGNRVRDPFHSLQVGATFFLDF